jgi:hypothetical protein
VVAAESLFFALAKKRNLSLCYLFVLCVSVVNFFLPRKWEYALGGYPENGNPCAA